MKFIIDYLKQNFKRDLIALIIISIAACTVIAFNKKANVSVNPDTEIKRAFDSEIKLNQKDSMPEKNDTIQ